MHDTAEYTDEKEIVDQKAIELAEDFSYDGYQVVRRELFAHLREPAVVIRRDSVTFNTACIAGLEDKKLNEYDILLFPTHWKGEGVPGILVEAKMAGLAVIASPMNFNAEIIREDKDEGFLLKKDYPNEMLEIIQKCMKDKKLLEHIKLESYRSRKRYAISEYEKMIKDL